MTLSLNSFPYNVDMRCFVLATYTRKRPRTWLLSRCALAFTSIYCLVNGHYKGTSLDWLSHLDQAKRHKIQDSQGVCCDSFSSYALVSYCIFSRKF